MLFVAIILSTVCHYSLVKWYKQRLVQDGLPFAVSTVAERAASYLVSFVGWCLFTAVMVSIFYLATLL